MFTHKRLNDALSCMVIAVCLYVIIWPLTPQLKWWLEHSAPVVSTPAANTAVQLLTVPATNTLYIPKLDLTQEIYNGTSEYTVNKGVWRRPLTATPDQSDNTVLVGHRFTYKGQGVFYFLDKLTAGDTITLAYDGHRYDYKVRATEVVDPTNLAVEAHTGSPVLTIYTCTPLWTSKSRLVIIADLVSKS